MAKSVKKKNIHDVLMPIVESATLTSRSLIFWNGDHSEAISKDLEEAIMSAINKRAKDYGSWLIENCIVSRKDGFRIGTSNWSKVISNEEAYELYLESLKNK